MTHVTTESFDYQQQVSHWINNFVDYAFQDMKRLVEKYENDAFASNDDMHTELRLMCDRLQDIKGSVKLRNMIERD